MFKKNLETLGFEKLGQDIYIFSWTWVIWKYLPTYITAPQSSMCGIGGAGLEPVSSIPQFSLHFSLSDVTNCNPLDIYAVFLHYELLPLGSIKFLPNLLEQLSELHPLAI